MYMLTPLQQKEVWEGWLGSEIRANYFGDLVVHYGAQQKLYTWLTLVFSSGAAAALISDRLPSNLSWIKAALAMLTAALSNLSLVQQNQKRATDAADLHFRWNSLAGQAQELWNNMYDENAASRLNELSEKMNEVSKSSTAFPYQERRMLKWEAHVVHHRAPGYDLPVSI
jgi:hypothetical protein